MSILPKEGWIRRKAESWLILLAAKILEGRNVNRAMVVSRRDNNDMAYMAEKLEAIAERIDEGYPEVRNG
ncbi:hypothetical protein [Pseudomonas luteola]|uniref:hypothetical protein n=1 Tax=Pseudomonas luteola TaxID=47886 RepID=UPI0015E286CC|nr:hypothetical protein [Pseudomonas zeshuii]MBA1249873.1 hypothetical protein [Pseudomonas zeshuii]